MNWSELTTEQIIGGITPDGIRYLKLFLQDYSRTFNVDNLTASCNSCIADYHKKYTIKMNEKANNSNFRLLEKYNGIQLEPCSSIFVNNGNITDEWGQILLEKKGAHLFSRVPETIVEQTARTSKRGRKSKQ